MKIVLSKALFIAMIVFFVGIIIFSIFTIETNVFGTIVNLEDIDSGLTSSTGDYRWMDTANQYYSVNYRNSYNYTQASVRVKYNDICESFHGTLHATNLKPNFAYQIKMVGFSGTPSNEAIGLAGRWWQEEWNGTAWSNGQNLNNKGNGSSPNPNDILYYARRNITNLTSPTGLKYRYTGYLVFDYFLTDEYGNATLNFEANSSYHVLWKTSQRTRAVDDGPLKSITFDANISSPAYDTDYPLQTVGLFGEWERLPVGGVYLQSGEYSIQLMLTEESFHGDGGQYAGNWAAAMGQMVVFAIPNVYVDDNAALSWYDATHVRAIQEGIDNATAGDTVYVYNGTYYENVVVNKTINLTGEDREGTIVDGGGFGNVFSITNNNVNIHGFTVQNSGTDAVGGIEILANNSKITSNNIFNNRHGVYPCYSYNSTISGNNILNNHDGIRCFDSSRNIIVDNVICSNDNMGIYLKGNSNNNILYDNTIGSNALNGIHIYSYCNDNVIYQNNIESNGNYGLYIYYPTYTSINNLVYHNNFIDNLHNARDECNNIWYNMSLNEGNYYDDYTGTDKNGDGIGDTPYNITGGSNQDLYPLMHQYTPWSVALNFTAPVDNSDYVVFGERPGAKDGQDSWDIPKPGIPPAPYIYSWFDAELNEPYNKLWEDYRYYPDNNKTWDLYVSCNISEPVFDSTNITISWDTAYVNNSEYDVFILRNCHNVDTTDMMLNGEYTFNASFNTLYHFQINCMRFQPPVANFTYQPVNATTGDIIQFNDTSTDTDGHLVNWTWNFGDDNVSYEQNATHQYTRCGAYTVNLTIRDDNGAEDSCEKTIKVYDAISVKTRWNIISIPFNESIDKTDIVVRNNSIDRSWDQAVDNGTILGFLYDYNRTTQSYDFSSYLEPGFGYWLWAYYDCELIFSSSEIGSGHISNLMNDWNIMGVPYNDTIAKTSVNVTNNSVDYTWNQAVSNNIILGFVYGWNTSDQLFELCDDFSPRRGYWIYAYYNCILRTGNQNDNVRFSDNFDDGDISDWTITTAGTGIFETSTAKYVSSPFSIHMKSVNKYDQAMGVSPIYDLNLSEDYDVSFHFLVPSKNNHWFEVFNNNQTYLVINNDTQLRWYNGSISNSIMNFNTDQWYLIEIVVHPFLDTYDIYIDSEFKTTCDIWIHTCFEDTFRVGDRNNDQGVYTDYGEAYWDDFIIRQS